MTNSIFVMKMKLLEELVIQIYIGICGWGMDMSNPSDLEAIHDMTRGLDYLIDVGETAAFAGSESLVSGEKSKILRYATNDRILLAI